MNQSKVPRGWLTTAQAAARLGVKPDTLYAYVSRGLVRSVRGTGGRASYFDPADVARLAQRPRRREPVPELTFRSTVTPGSALSLARGAVASGADVRFARRIAGALPARATASDKARAIAVALAATGRTRTAFESARRTVAVLTAALGVREEDLHDAIVRSAGGSGCAIAARLAASAGADVPGVVVATVDDPDPVTVVAQAALALAHALEEWERPAPLRVRVAGPPREARRAESSLASVMEYLREG
jgi:hypothetical protein